jgi:hypothetical protein
MELLKDDYYQKSKQFGVIISYILNSAINC